MIDLLSGIFDVVKGIGHLFLWAVVSFINLLIAAVGAALGVVLSVFPTFPPAPTFANSQVLGAINFFFPIAELLAIAATFVALWIGFLLIRMAARWVKAL